MFHSQQCEGSNCLILFVKSGINALIISVENVGVIPWCIFWWFIWYYVHWTYNWVFESILKKTTIKEEKYKLLIKLYWKIAFASLSIPFALENLKLDYIDVSDRFYYVLENHISRWFASQSSSLQTKMSYVILSGFYLNNISEVCLEFGLYSKEFILNELFGLFFIATYPLKCVEFGLAVAILVNIVDCFIALANVFICLGDIAHSVSLRLVISHIFLVIHVLLWLFVYFHILPMHFMAALIKKMDQRTDAKQLSMFFLLNCTFVAYYIIYIITCPLTMMIYEFVIRRTRYSQAVSEESVIEENERNRNIRKKENLKMLYHAVKCVINMRRKLAKMRLQKQATNCNNLNYFDETPLDDILENEKEDDGVEIDDAINDENGEPCSEIGVKKMFTKKDSDLKHTTDNSVINQSVDEQNGVNSLTEETDLDTIR